MYRREYVQYGPDDWECELVEMTPAEAAIDEANAIAAIADPLAYLDATDDVMPTW